MIQDWNSTRRNRIGRKNSENNFQHEFEMAASYEEVLFGNEKL